MYLSIRRTTTPKVLSWNTLWVIFPKLVSLWVKSDLLIPNLFAAFCIATSFLAFSMNGKTETVLSCRALLRLKALSRPAYLPLSSSNSPARIFSLSLYAFLRSLLFVLKPMFSISALFNLLSALIN